MTNFSLLCYFKDMNDKETKLQEIKDQLIEFRDKRNWAKYHKVKDLACAINIEAGELLDELVWKTDNEIENLLKDKETKEIIEMELADVIIYCLHFACIVNTDVARAIEKKMKLNSQKYPES